MTNGGGDTVGCLKMKIFKYDQFGNFIDKYASISEASIIYNISSRNIGHAIDQRNKNTCCNHYWFSSKEKAKIFKFKISMRNSLPILQFSLDGNFLREFKNKKEAEILLKIGRSSLSRVLQTKGLKSTKGYLWFYKGDVPKVLKKYRKSFYNI
jgi:hypothetical protein